MTNSRVRNCLSGLRKRRAVTRRALLALLALLLSAGVSVGLADGGDTAQTYGVIGAGAQVSAQSATHRVTGTLGQWAVGRGQSSDRMLEAGFWSSGLCDCRFHGDCDASGDPNIIDVVLIVNAAFKGGPNPIADATCPHLSRGDVNCDGIINVIDVVVEVAAAFRGDNQICDPCAD